MYVTDFSKLHRDTGWQPESTVSAQTLERNPHWWKHNRELFAPEVVPARLSPAALQECRRPRHEVRAGESELGFPGSTYFGCQESHYPLELLFACDRMREAGHEALLIDAQNDRSRSRKSGAGCERSGRTFW